MADAKSAESPNGELWTLVRRAERGDKSAMPAVRKAMDASPALVEHLGDVATQVENTLLRNMTAKALAFREAVERKMARMRADLAGPDASPLEQLLAARIALCWLSLHDAELRFAQASDLTISQAKYWQLQISACHKRYLSAIKTLAVVRKLAVPAVQVNIARRQVNVLAAPASGEPVRATRPAERGTVAAEAGQPVPLPGSAGATHATIS